MIAGAGFLLGTQPGATLGALDPRPGDRHLGMAPHNQSSAQSSAMSRSPMSHTAISRRPNLCGTVAVDLSGETGADDMARAVAALSGAGWTLTDTPTGAPGEIHLTDGDTEGPAIHQVSDAKEAARLNAVAPDAGTILAALGGMQMEQALAASVPGDLIADRVIVGFNWTMVRSGDLCGIARSPARGTEGARTIRPEDGFVGKPLSALAGYLNRVDPLARSLGLAAVNCYWNRADPRDGQAVYRRPSGGLGAIAAPGDGALIIGGFRGAQKRLTKARIIEREPKPGDIPVHEAPAAYAAAHTLAITAQTLMNGSLTPILDASHAVPFRTLVGPSAPGCPVLFDHGLDEIAASAIIDPDAAEQFVLETGTMIMRDHMVQSFWMRPGTDSGNSTGPR